jgi:hypothetical protein
MIEPNLLHIVLLGFAVMCAYFTLGEMNHRSLRRPRLFAPVLFAAACALVFLLFHLGAKQPQWVFGAVFVGGLVIGTVRGFTLPLQIDHMFARVRLPRARGSFLVALALVGAVLLEIGGAFAGASGTPFRLVAPEIAAGCAGMLTGRAVAIAMRWRGTPHIDFQP